MKRITFADSAGMTLMELGMALMVERDNAMSLLATAKEFETHWRTVVEPEEVVPCYRRMIERGWLEPHPTESDRMLITVLGKATSYTAFLAFVRMVDPTGGYFKASVVFSLTTGTRCVMKMTTKPADTSLMVMAAPGLGLRPRPRLRDVVPVSADARLVLRPPVRRAPRRQRRSPISSYSTTLSRGRRLMPRILSKALAAMLLIAPLSPAAAATGGLIDDPVRPDDFYCGERKLGTWFYCSKPKPKPKEEATPPAPLAPAESATERLDKVTAELRELKAEAILEPTPEHIEAYVRYQRAQLDRASMFSDVWQRAVWQKPELDYTLQRPVGTVAKRQWLDTRKVDRDQALTHLGERYGLFYFFAQSCGACEIFSPILKSVADSHGLHVMAVSTDGGPSDVFIRYAVDSGQRERMGLTEKTTPAVVLFDTVTRRAVPIGYGVMAADELMDRIYTLTQKEPGSDY